MNFEIYITKLFISSILNRLTDGQGMLYLRELKELINKVVI